MEDIITIIWVVLIILGAITNAIHKRTTKETEEAQEPTAEPSQRPVVIRVPAPAPEARSIESESLESLESLETNWQRKPFKRPSKPFKATQARKKQATQPLTRLQPKTKVEPQQEETHELMRDFDLERAVVYSEILKPKYREYE